MIIYRNIQVLLIRIRYWIVSDPDIYARFSRQTEEDSWMGKTEAIEGVGYREEDGYTMGDSGIHRQRGRRRQIYKNAKADG